MKTYEYMGFDTQGRASRGLVEALNVKDARDKLVGRGILADEVRSTSRKCRVSADMRSVIYREMGTMLAAGHPLVKALDTLVGSVEMARHRAALGMVRDRVKDGAPLSEALAEAMQSVGAFEKAVVETGERSGALAAILERLASYIEQQEKLRARIRSAMIYPSIVVAAGICVAVLMLSMLVPRTRTILAANNIPLPLLTRAVIRGGQILLYAGPAALALICSALFLARRRWRSDEAFRTTVDKALFRVPLFGKGYRIAANLRFSRTLAILARSGISAVDGIRLAGRATGSPWIESLAAEGAEAIRHGASLSETVRKIPPLADTMPGWIEVGESSGDISQVLDRVGERYEARWDRFLSVALGFLEPVLILAIGIFVLIVALSVLLPILSLSQGIR